jgi:hypothetical protein
VSRTASTVAQVLTIVLGLVIACLVIFPLAAKMVDPIRSDNTSELGRIDYLDNQKLIRRLKVATKLDCLSGFHRFHLAKAREARVRELMSGPSGTVFDSALLGKINAVYADYGRAIELHPTNGYYRMNLAFFTMLFVDYPEMWAQINAGAAAASGLSESYPLQVENRFLQMCYDHMLLAVRLDPNNPNLHRAHYMVCFYLFRRMERDGEIRMADRLLLDGNEACRKYLTMSPTYVGDDGREHSSAEEALRWFSRHVSVDPERMASLLPASVRNRDALIDRIAREHNPRGETE